MSNEEKDDHRISPEKLKKVHEIVVPLAYPIDWGDETISELRLRRPKGKDLEHMSAEPTMKELMMVAQKCAKVPRRVIEELDSEDVMELVEAVADFLESGQRTGRKRLYS